MQAPLKFYIFIIALTALFNSSCKKDPILPDMGDALPPYTETGANTFACKVNGKGWVAHVTAMFPSVPVMGGGYVYRDKTFSIYGSKENNTFSEMVDIGKIVNVKGTGEFVLNAMPNFAYYEHTGPKPDFLYSTDSLHTGKVTITKLDTAMGIVSGRFYFDVKNENGSDIIHITEGQFDYKY